MLQVMPPRKRRGIDRQHSSSFPIGTRFAGLPIGDKKDGAKASSFYFVKSSQKFLKKFGATPKKGLTNRFQSCNILNVRRELITPRRNR